MKTNPAQFVILLALRVYQCVVSPVLRGLFGPVGGCRFTPSCSQYAVEAVVRHGAIKGGALAFRRLCRCHPWGGFGNDPVPELSSCCGQNHSDLMHATEQQSTSTASLMPARVAGRN